MKAVIITLALSDNYGAVLQSYALAEKVKQLGIDVKIYKYQDKKRITFNLSFKAKVRYAAWGIVRFLLTLGKKKRNYQKFRKNYLPLTPKRYKNSLDLRKDLGEYDLYISGSDQIWNPDLFIYDTSYFFDFLSDDKKRISYASSFGKASFNEDYKELCGEYLSKYSSISVREQSGVNIVNKLCGKAAECTLDPTLLLTMEEWDEIAIHASKRAKKFKGILCYVMEGDPKVVNAIEEIAQKLSKETSLPIMRLGIKEYRMLKYGKNGSDVTASPIDYLKYFMNAEYVVTNSFHGTAFAVNFAKKFYVPINDELPREKALHERISSLLTMVNATDAIIPISSGLRLKNIDLEQTKKILVSERERSLAYLKKAVDSKC